MAVPNTTTFSLQDVVTEIVPVTDSLSGSFADATLSFFDPLYSGSLDSLLNFRNYAASTSYDDVRFLFASQSLFGTAFEFKPDGTKLYIIGDEIIYQYSMSTAWDLSTCTYDVVSGSFTSIPNAGSFTFKPDGTVLYVTEAFGTIYEYSLSTAWDVSTTTYVTETDFTAEAPILRDIRFKPDGTKLYIIGNSRTIHQYSISPAWAISGSTYDSASFDVGLNNAGSMELSSDGTKIFIGFTVADDLVKQYSTSAAWAISGSTYDSVSFDPTTQDQIPLSIRFKPDGTKFYISGDSTNYIYQYSAKSAWDIS